MRVIPEPQSITAWPIMVARLGQQVVPTLTFARLLVRAEYDSHGVFNDATSVYVIPESGVYRLEGKVRILDSDVPSGASIGLGIDRTETDGPSFFWGVSNPSRQGVINQRVSYFDQGDALRLFVYVDHPGAATVGVASAEFTLDRIR